MTTKCKKCQHDRNKISSSLDEFLLKEAVWQCPICKEKVSQRLRESKNPPVVVTSFGTVVAINKNGAVHKLGCRPANADRENFKLMSRNGVPWRNNSYLDWSRFHTYDQAVVQMTNELAQQSRDDGFFIIVEA